MAALIQTYEPGGPFPRGRARAGLTPRASKLLRSVRELAQSFGIRTYAFSKVFVQAAFAASEAVTKEEIVRAVTGRYPELSHRMPPERKIWLSEDHRTSLFDAVALRRRRGRQRGTTGPMARQ